MNYAETRRHELRKTRMQMIDGNLATNSRSAEGGASVRVYDGGYWGFASAPDSDAAGIERLRDKAGRNAREMARFGPRSTLVLPGGSYRGEHVYAGRPALTQKDCMDRLAQLHAWCAQRYPGLKSTRFVLHDEHHSKWLSTSEGSESLASIQRAVCMIVLVAEDEHGAPVEMSERLSGKGSLADLDLSLQALAPLLDGMHKHLQAKRQAVPARGGLHTVVMGPDLTGILAHEAMGHPCEADIVLGGAVTRDLVGTAVASELVSMVDYAHTFGGEELMVPVYADDEGTPARDAVLIERGRLTDFMTSRETAARLDIAPTGSARAYNPHDEPLVRMRNTAILPGSSRLDEMIAGVDDGYLLL
ncbi:MAG TPA: TldD/PmbA family protein, partial [Albitalea sp.]|nr:TldD/PmbA family protein [Albitalea sp.]